jgi:hypothetical protein
MVFEFVFVCMSLHTIGNTFTTAPKLLVRAVLLARVVSSVLAGDCVRREVLASQLRGTDSRATTGNPIVRVIDGDHWGCPELPGSPPTPCASSAIWARRAHLWVSSSLSVMPPMSSF